MNRRVLVWAGVAWGWSGVLACGGDDGAGTGATSDTDPTSTTAPASSTSTSTSTTTGTTDPDTSATGSSTGSSTDTDTDTGVPVCPYPPVDGKLAVELELVANGFNRPVLALGDPTQPDRLFVVEQSGNVKVLEPGQTSAPTENFLSLDVAGAGATTVGDERGLLGFAFHPGFPDDPRVYVAYNPAGGGGSPPTIVEEYTVTDGGNGVADPGSARLVIAADQPAGNHNGGMIAFGPDNYLYFGLGDGGGADGQFDTSRDTGVLLAKMLRIDVEPDGTPDEPISCENFCQATPGPLDYTIPDDNPFVDDPAFAPEIYATGMRNPWRFSFDSADGTLYVADVGQNVYEEVHVVEAGGDYGWNSMEGNHCFAQNGCDESAGPNQVNADGLIAPIAEYSHAGARCSVTGLGSYHACEVPAWDGLYFYGDYCTGELFALAWDGTTTTELGTVWTSDADDRLLGGGSNLWGDVFVTTAVSPDFGFPFTDGRVYRVAPAR